MVLSCALHHGPSEAGARLPVSSPSLPRVALFLSRAPLCYGARLPRAVCLAYTRAGLSIPPEGCSGWVSVETVHSVSSAPVHPPPASAGGSREHLLPHDSGPQQPVGAVRLSRGALNPSRRASHCARLVAASLLPLLRASLSGSTLLPPVALRCSLSALAAAFLVCLFSQTRQRGLSLQR